MYKIYLLSISFPAIPQQQIALTRHIITNSLAISQFQRHKSDFNLNLISQLHLIPSSMKSFISLLALPATLLSIAAAAPVDDPATSYNQAQFRTYGGTDCFTTNHGHYSVHIVDVNVCKPLTILPVGSVLLQQITNPKCQLLFFNEPSCNGASFTASTLGQCYVKDDWTSYKLVCAA